MNDLLTQIRPLAEHLTDDRSAQMMRSVMNSPRPRLSRSPWKTRATAGALGAAVIFGGVAYATGALPRFVQDRFDQVTSGDGWPEAATNERVVASVALGNGRTARVWRADTRTGVCEVRDTTGARTPEGLAAGCSRLSNSDRSKIEQGTFWQVGTAGPGLFYGEYQATRAVSSVRVSGPNWMRAAQVEASGTFATALPAVPDGTMLRATYLDSAGRVLGEREIEATSESE